MSEAPFEEFLKREARDYRTPPAETPRDEMWAAIAEARAARRATSASAAAPGPATTDAPGGAAPADVIRLDSRRPTRRVAPWLGMAATLVIGIGIGRMAWPSPDGAAVQPAADVATGTGSAGTSPLGSTALPSAPAGDPVDLLAQSAGAQAAVSPRDGRTSDTRLVARAAAPGPERRGTLPAATAAPTSTSLSMVSRDHLQRAEALVSVVAQTPADAVMDSLTGRWAREMLVNTRLLLDSPAGDDPARRRLLEDLETVLVQLVQRSGAAAEERALLDRTLERTQLLTRLRSGAAGI